MNHSSLYNHNINNGKYKHKHAVYYQEIIPKTIEAKQGIRKKTSK